MHFFPFGSINYENIEQLHCNEKGQSGPLFLCFDQEPITKYLHNTITKVVQEWGYGKKIILMNTEKNSSIKNSIMQNNRIIDCYYFFHIFAALDWYRGYQFNAEITDPATRNIYKKYITFNRITGDSRSYRSLFVAKLAELNLIEYGNISYSDICPVHGDYITNLNSLSKQRMINHSIIDNAIHNLQKIKFPLRLDDNADFIMNGSQTIDPMNKIMESFLHVVTETCFWDTKQHLTEKIFKPIVCKQPFVLLGCTNNLQYFKSYGFKTFDKWWDESYDQIADPIKRIHVVVNIINHICSLSNTELEKMLVEMKEVLDFNYDLFYSKQFILDAWKEVQNNMQSAVAQIGINR